MPRPTAFSRPIWGLRVVCAALILAAVACTLQIGDDNARPTIPVQPTVERPSVQIISPPDGSTVTKGQRVSVQARAQSASGVTLIELLVNDVRVASQPPAEAINPTTLDAVLDYQANQAGTLRLVVRAYSNAIVGQPAQITINVVDPLSPGTGGTASTPSSIISPVPYNPQCRARVNTSLNFRSGPATTYDRIGTFDVGQELPIIGYFDQPDGRWFQVPWGSQRGWVAGYHTTALGDCSTLRPAVVPPTPTAPPSVTPPPTIPNATATPGLPDLRFSVLTGPTEVQLSAGGSTQASYQIRVRNYGQRPSGSFRVALLKPNGTVDYVTVNNLDPNQEYAIADGNYTVTFTTPGLARLLVTADDQGVVVEADETNNQTYLNINVLAAPATAAPPATATPSATPEPTADSGGTVVIPVDTLPAISTGNANRLHSLAAVPGHSSEIGGMAFGPTGTLVTAGADGRLQVWNVAGGTVAQTLTGHTDRVTDVAANPNGTSFASASWDGTVRLWAAASGAAVQTLSFGGQVEHVAFSPDGSRLAAGGLNPGGAGGLQGLIRVWDAADGRSLMSLELFGPVSGIAFTSSATLAVATQDQDCTLAGGAVELYTVGSSDPIRVLTGHSGSLDALAVSPDGSQVAAGGQESLCSGSAVIWLWNAGDGSLLRTFVLGSETRITDLAFSPNGSLLASSSMDGTVRLWDVNSGAALAAQSGPGWSMGSLSFRPGGALIASGSADGSVSFWGAS